MSQHPETPAPATQEWQGEISPAHGHEQSNPLRRYWWATCLAGIVLLALIAGIAGLMMMLQHRSAPVPPPTTTQSATGTESPSPSYTGPRSDDIVTEGLVPLGSDPVSHTVVTTNGRGEVSISQEWKSASEIQAREGSEIPEAQNGEYLVLVVQLEVTAGEVYNNPLTPEVHTKDGGVATATTATYAQPESAGVSVNVTRIPAGNTVTMQILYDIPRSDRLYVMWSGDKRGSTWTITP